ncbi:MAG: hypothetical protein JSV25_15470 [Spirochaetota bacterium]|nr:MAG: hypothetical protein JSV25_15470 [Spirochaetota bacterium]
MSRKIIITTVTAAFVFLTTATLFANGYGMQQFGEKHGYMGNPHYGNRAAYCKPVQHMGPGMRGGDVGILGQLAGIDEIHRKYQLEMQRVFLDAKQEALSFYEEQQDLREKFFDLINEYEESSVKDRREISDLLKQVRENQKKIQVIQESSMEKINALHQEQKKEMEKALEIEINRLSANAEEMDKFIEMIKQRWPYDFPPSPGRGRKM